MIRHEGDRLRQVVVSTPGAAYFDVTDLRASNILERPDRDLTLRQFDRLVETLKAFGARVIDVPALPGHPNCVFPRDVGLVTPEGLVQLRMGLPSRRGEEEWMTRALADVVGPCVGRIVPPGTVEGGDVVLAGSVAFVGQSRRTNASGREQLTSILSPMGYTVRCAAVPDPFLHLGGAMSVIGAGRVVCRRGLFPPGFFDGFATVEIESDGPSAGNVVCLEDGVVVADGSDDPTLGCGLEQAGVTVHRLDLREFRKGAGGPTCLVLPLDRA